ncbi:MAG: cytochrome c [Alphaproteobacteria bacterium]|jgi:nitrite reductase (NO-forming)/hydroxylamine reductase|nr:cytochrome c [Alphaproteobacteria bacterium]
MWKLRCIAVPIALGIAMTTTVGGALAAKKMQPIPTLTDEEFKKGQHIYFDRCSGCHGALRKGATGPNITPEKTRLKTLAALDKILFEGTDAGMPGWGRDGFMTREETQLMAKYVQGGYPHDRPLGLSCRFLRLNS